MSRDVAQNLRSVADQLENIQNHEIDQRRNNRKIGHVERLVFSEDTTAQDPEYHHTRGFKSFVIRSATSSNTTVKVCFNRDFKTVFEYKVNSVFNSPFPVSEAVFFGDDQDGQEMVIEIYDYAVVSTGSINEIKASVNAECDSAEELVQITVPADTPTLICADLTATHSKRSDTFWVDDDLSSNSVKLSYDSDMGDAGLLLDFGDIGYHNSLVPVYAFSADYEAIINVLSTRKAK